MNPAQATRLDKEKHPERFCPKCLWRVVTTQGMKPCRKHVPDQHGLRLYAIEQEKFNEAQRDWQHRRYPGEGAA